MKETSFQNTSTRSTAPEFYRKHWLLLCCALAAVTYLPSLNNNFIADDWVILERVEILKGDPTYLFGVPPENFRLVSYLIFGAIKSLAGYEAWPFYVFNIGLHMLNIVLLASLLKVLIADEVTIGIAVLFFAVFQAPQEAVMWLAAMNETTSFFFMVLTLLLWANDKRLLATGVYALALFSKESAILTPALVCLMDWYKTGRPLRWATLILLVPTAAFIAIFLGTVGNNFMLTSRSYSVGPRAVLVLANSVHRLAWPWGYIILVFLWRKRAKLSGRSILACLGLLLLTMTPYMFITFQNSLPSRQVYLASAVLMTMFGVLLRPLHKTRVRDVFVVAFVVFNVAYVWFRKDGQFEERAAPTTQLVEVLRTQSPQRAVVANFAYPYPDIALAASWAVPGWTRDLLSVDTEPQQCQGCLRFTWNNVEQRYETAAE